VGAPIAVVHLSSGDNPPTVTDVGRSRFAALVEYARKKGIKIAFENQRKLFNLAWALETFGPEDGVGFCWDCGHEGCFTPGKQFMPWFADRLICTHIHDNYGIFDDDRHLLPFDGKLDFERVARQLREANWQGSVMLEVILGKNSHYKGSNYEDLTPEQYLIRAADAAKKLAKMI
jgi:sugar phosphate isomerase/epimerase